MKAGWVVGEGAIVYEACGCGGSSEFGLYREIGDDGGEV